LPFVGAHLEELKAFFLTNNNSPVQSGELRRLKLGEEKLEENGRFWARKNWTY